MNDDLFTDTVRMRDFDTAMRQALLDAGQFDWTGDLAGFADTDTSALEPLAQAVLDARAAHPGATLADLYDPDLMPPNLRRAHQALDRVWIVSTAGSGSRRSRNASSTCSRCTSVYRPRSLRRLRNRERGVGDG